VLDFLPLVAGFAVAVVAIGLLNRAARRIGAVSRQTDDRWHGAGGIPHLAGPGMLLAMVPWFPPLQGLVLAGFCAIGTADDIRPLSAPVKAVLLVLPSAVAGWVTGEAWVAVLIWFVANAVNLLDHADGLAAATALVAFLFAGTAGSLASAGACVGLLIYNHPPARAFMGDGGSLMLGAGLVLVWSESGLATTMIWCAIPLADAVFVTLRRLGRGQWPWVGGTDHSGHILLGAGFPPRLLPLTYGLAAAAVGFGCQALVGTG
jgi:UDP-GlcNAc:undecaprenyl-phosphate GlcNAc-1-phosphate transferase